MNINRNNYEEYFLLYIDNELSQQDRNMVELFVQQNTGLEEEFLMLRQSVVRPDKNIMLENKSFLFRDKKFINKNNYEEVFILYNDNELNEEERKQTELFVKENPGLQNEFALLQKIKVEADGSIVFPGKRLLYKKEERVIPLIWWRIAAAAVLAGLGLWGGVHYMQSNKAEKMVVIKNPVVQPKKIILLPVLPKEQLPAEQQNVATNKNVITNKKTNDPLLKNNTDSPLLNTASENKNAVVKNNETNKLLQKDPGKTGINPTAQKNEDIVVKEPQKKQDEIITPSVKNIEKVNPNDVAHIENNTVVSPGYVQAASYIPEEKNDNYVFYNVSEEKFKKTRLFGFLKKVTRVIERKNPFGHNNESKEVAVK